MFNGVRDVRAKGAVRGRGSINSKEVILEFRTVARTELGKDCSVMPVKGQLRGINFRRDVSKNWIRSRRLDRFLDSSGLELRDGFLVDRRGKSTICEERFNCREKFRLESGLFTARTRRSSYIGMGGVGRA